MDRRKFLQGAVTGATVFALRQSQVANAIARGLPLPNEGNEEKLAQMALDTARKAGASYADIRINRYTNQYIGTREEKVLSVGDSESFGFGVRVLASGAWGFASSTMYTPEEVVRVTKAAVVIAKANATIQKEPVVLARTASYKDKWQTPIQINPFTVPIDEKVGLLLNVNKEALKVKGTKYCSSSLFAAHEHKIFASTEGSYIEQDIYRIWPEFTVTAVSADGTDFQSRNGFCQPMGRGYEYVREYPMLNDAREAGENAVAKLSAQRLERPTTMDLVLYPSHLWLVVHESCAHATELDRALGYEANFAGTSFITTDNLGKLNYGSDIVNIVGDRTEKNGLSTVGYDDEGVKASRFDIIKDGQFVNYQTIREQAKWIGQTESHGCAYADSYEHMPMQRMPNVSLQPGKTPMSPQDLLNGVDEGILIKGNGSWSIDQQRRNFQFGGQVFYKIKSGAIVGMLRDVAYQSMTLDFWRSCEAICSKEYYELGGSYYCGKAQPEQVAPVSHGSAPALFRRMYFINTARKV